LHGNERSVDQGRSQDFTLEATEAERRWRDNRGAEAPREWDWGGGVRLGDLGERHELPQRGPG